MCFIKTILNENGMFMLLKSLFFFVCFLMYGSNTDYITYIGCVQAIKNYICKTGLTVESNSSTDLTQYANGFLQSTKRLKPILRNAYTG